jgi:hypothetical protein
MPGSVSTAPPGVRREPAKRRLILASVARTRDNFFTVFSLSGAAAA